MAAEVDEFDILELPPGGIDMDALEDDPFGYAPAPKRQEAVLSTVNLPVTDIIIGDLSERFLGLKINGINDTKGLAVAKEAKKECVRVRNLIEESREKLKKPHLEAGRAIDKEAKRLQEMLEPVETYVGAQIETVEKSLKQIERERQDKIYERRKLELAAVGLALPEASVRAMTDEEFANLIDRSVQEFEERQEEARIRGIQQREFEAQQAKQREQQAEIDRQRRELAEQQQAIDRQKAAAAKAEQDRLDAIEREKRREAAKLRAEQMKPHSEKLRAFADRVEALVADVPQIDPAIDQVVTGFITSAAGEMRWIAQGLVSIDSPIPAIELPVSEQATESGDFDDI